MRIIMRLLAHKLLKKKKLLLLRMNNKRQVSKRYQKKVSRIIRGWIYKYFSKPRII